MKKAILLLFAMLCVLALVGCSQGESSSAPVASAATSSTAVSSPTESPAISEPEPTPVPEPEEAGTQANVEDTQQEGSNMVNLQIGEHNLTAELADNPSAQAFADLLAQEPVTVEMHDYAGMEKVGTLPTSLPETNQPIDTVPGDLILYQGNSITVYYGTNSWSLTRLGKLQGVTGPELQEILGAGDVEVTFSLADEP